MTENSKFPEFPEFPEISKFPEIYPLRTSDYRTLDVKQIFGVCPRAEASLHAGHAAAVILAGGMGSRLGRTLPKGMCAVSPVKEKSLFQLHFEKIYQLRQRYDASIPIYIMVNRASIPMVREFLEKHDFWGVPFEDVFLFVQNELPAVNEDGSLFYDSRGNRCFGPDGHGGLISALESSGAYADMETRGVRTLCTFHIDNPLVPVLNEAMLGMHWETKSEMTSVVVEKFDGMELVGNIVRDSDGHFCVVEYMDFPMELANLTTPSGTLRFWAGSVGIHLIQLDFLIDFYRNLVENPALLPFHHPKKKIITQDGPVFIRKPERFLFDILPRTKNPLIVKMDRAEIFTTLKKSTEIVRDHLNNLYKNWLQKSGAVFSPNASVEIAASFAMDQSTCMAKITPGTTFSGHTIYLD